MAQPVIRVFPDLESLSREAAEQFVRLAQQQAHEGRRFSVALAGGSTPRRLYELLAGEPYRSRVPWEVVHVFWSDERWVPSDHPDSNFRQAFDLLLTHVPLPAVNIYRVPIGSGDATLAAATYERTLQTFFKLQDGAWPAFDLVVLGLGEDGHVASLFPKSAALQETHHSVIATTGGNPDVPRVTLTLPVLNHAKRLLWLVAGAKKASVVRDALEGADRAEELPAQLVRPAHGTALWFLDRAAAGLLKAREPFSSRTHLNV